jgi:5-methylcytosine-specific restriction endonuclease McrA
MNASIAIDDERKRRIVELFEDGRTYAQIRNEFGVPSSDFLPFEDFLRIIGASSERDYRRIHANIERRMAYHAKRSTIERHRTIMPRDEDVDNWQLVRKRVLESNLGACLFCHHNADDVHHILGRKEGGASMYLVPVCKNHFNMFHRRNIATDGNEVRKIATRIAQVYPRLYVTVRKSIQTEEHELMTYTVARIRYREHSITKDDPCPGWMATSEREEASHGPRCVILHFELVVSETGFDNSIWTPIKRESTFPGGAS